MVASQAEIWDDSILIESWNDALEEYKKYHSIAACKTNHNESVETFGSPSTQTVGETTTNDCEEDLPSNSPRASQTAVCNERSDNHHDEQKTLNTEPEDIKENKSVPVIPQHLVGQDS
ncbi:putative survival motor neuron-like protein 1 [Golovinomyces cichoracearum]|uniref:Putative survival motor neuron-like protein 1 n=1 Tax=Golovinomyces cichoracearum TaxID=62708 RepID=A0A420J6W6_9PEZI|nr:putative survival motor neuron-like protein 1 [Golovinomyces cichoracearum]